MYRYRLGKGLLLITLVLGLVFINTGVTKGIDKAKIGDVSKCLECHEEEAAEWEKGPHAKSLDLLKGIDKVKKECLSCHSTDYQLSNKKNELTVSKVKYGVNCLSCHNDDPEIGKSRDKHLADYKKLRRSEKETCGECHSAQLANGVAKPGQEVNHAQQNLYYGFGGINVEDRPAEMVRAGVTCSSCHMLPKEKGAKRAHTFRSILPGEGEPNSCINSGCHANFGSTMFAGMLEMRVMEVEDMLATVKEKLKAKRDYKNTEAYKVAKTNYLMVKEDKSQGLHNLYYTRSLLWEAEDQLDSIKVKEAKKEASQQE
ncbi:MULTISPECIES: multiheme c-type cytochrome [unclassified Candidatus Frackibacter]|uniref:multiheme c-type cytochrome n=1 Tax=unclassified Candidatus Frackibacter TaxID=2648818 RepID=UPI000886C7F3|nr:MULTISPECIES: cytochrome c3 family protein [unclassified Candidatus Frackibacter]SDC12318.1 Cytochrome c554 and c-prime [Candidatus Frackibacter sp. WG11]SEM35920.1 Cytochrome c554 and c-prime [Candidatus Frackibacter sp. WG12]SFL41141.1 Cytochrome c554 and c-prime [Candidatus Frackibacter sp. WG13]